MLFSFVIALQFHCYQCVQKTSFGVLQMMKDRVIKCLQKASEKGCKTMAMTALGVGKLKYPPHFVARTTLAIVSDFMEQRKTSLKCVHFVIYPGDQGTLTV